MHLFITVLCIYLLVGVPFGIVVERMERMSFIQSVMCMFIWPILFYAFLWGCWKAFRQLWRDR